MNHKRIMITGTAGFIGFHLARLLLKQGHIVHGYDGLTDYYDVTLKNRRHGMLNQSPSFSSNIGMLENVELFNSSINKFCPEIIIHLAGQAGVRYSIENPRSYIDSNIIGTFNVLEAARELKVEHLLMASTSSVYGANTNLPFEEKDKTDTPLTLYAATKKANENMAHSYSNLWQIPTTMFRFFTVYGPWGRPDLALFKFVKAILDNQPIDIYNYGNMYRDFTYVEDLVHAISLLIDKAPSNDESKEISQHDSLSPVAPFRIVNIGNSQKISLMDYIEAIELSIGKKAIRNYLPMQIGDVPATLASSNLLKELTGYSPDTDYKVGIDEFISWYREYYEK